VPKHFTPKTIAMQPEATLFNAAALSLAIKLFNKLLTVLWHCYFGNRSGMRHRLVQTHGWPNGLATMMVM